MVVAVVIRALSNLCVKRVYDVRGVDLLDSLLAPGEHDPGRDRAQTNDFVQRYISSHSMDRALYLLGYFAHGEIVLDMSLSTR